MSQDPRIDDYIGKAAPFAQPILKHLRDLVHAVVPGVEETLKWSMPHFAYKGKNIAGFAAFKAHAAFMIHGDGRQGDAMGQYGKIAALSDLPEDSELKEKILEAKARVDAAGTALKPKSAPKTPKAEIEMPADFAQALAGNPAASTHFSGFPPGARRDYLEWITTAKRPETRASRIETAVEWLAEGKKRNWKYEAC